MKETARWTPPQRFEEYRLVRELGAGAMGQVYLAHDTLLDRPVAIKFIRAAHANAAARERFFTEARAVARLSHPNVVAVHRVGEVMSRPYLVSEFVAGMSLDTLAKPLPWDRALKLALGIARGLAAAHRRGVLHRDLKPANIVVADGDEPVLLDFGLAKLISDEPSHESAVVLPTVSDLADTASVDHLRAVLSTQRRSEAGLTVEGALVGTPLYLAPELWTGGPASTLSDIYSLGVVLYELVAGTAPHAGLGLDALASTVVSTPAPPVTSRANSLPPDLAGLIDACLALSPRDRPGTADVVGDQLQSLTGHAVPTIDGSPYPGLALFEKEDRAIFFGRGEDARIVVDRMRIEPLIVVTGDAGIGKSSMCRAAVLPEFIERPAGGLRWRTSTIIPGARPMATLATVLAQRAPDEGLLIFIDQLEELITVAAPAEAAEVANTLASLISSTSTLRILASARIDFLGRLAGLGQLGELVGRGVHLLSPMPSRGLREAIVFPARERRFEFESDELVEALIALGRRSLPLLQFTLAKLWESRDVKRRLIDMTSLDKGGGVTKAFIRHGEQVIGELGEHDRTIALRCFLRLTTEEGKATSMARRDLIRLVGDPGAGDRMIERLIAARLLTVAGDEARIELVHEAILTEWPRLTEWREKHEPDLRMREQVAEAARRWRDRREARSLLWRDDLLREYQRWRERWNDSLLSVEQRFCDESVKLDRRNRRSRRFALAGLVTCILIGAGVAYKSILEARGLRAETQRQSRLQFVREGEHQLLLNQPARALKYFTQALSMGEDTPATRFLIARASAPSSRERVISHEARGHIDTALSPHGDFIASLSFAGVRVFDAQDHLVLDAALDSAYAFSFSPDSRWFVAGDGHGVLHIWDTVGWKREDKRLEQEGFADAIFSPNSRQIVLRSPHRAQVYDLESRYVVRTIEPESSATSVHAAVFSPGGDAVLTVLGTGDWTWTSIADGRTLGRGQFEAAGYAFARTVSILNRVYVIKNATLYLFDSTLYTRPALSFVVSTRQALDLDVAPSAQEVAIGSSDGSVKRWNTTDHRQMGETFTTEGAAISVRYNHAGSSIAAASEGGQFLVWDLASSRVDLAVDGVGPYGRNNAAPSGSPSVAFAADDHSLLAGSRIDLRVIDLGSQQHLRHFGRLGVNFAQFSPDGRSLLCSGGDAPAALSRISDAEQLATLALPAKGRIAAVFWKDNEPQILLITTDSGAYAYRRDGTLLSTLARDASAINSAEFSLDGAQLLLAGKGGSQVYDVASGALLKTFEQIGDASAAHWIEPSRIVTAGADGLIRFFDRATGELELRFDQEMTTSLEVSVRPGGRILAVATGNGEVALWNIETHARVAVLTGHTAPVTSLAWSPDGALLASIASDGFIKIWDPESIHNLETINVGSFVTPFVSWSAEGDMILTAGAPNVPGCDLWDVSRDQRSIAAIQDFVTTHLPYALIHGVLFRNF